MSILSARAIKLQLDGRSILKGVDLDLPSGGFQLIIGPNGAGKSCLLKCLLGLHDYSGEVKIEDRPVSELSPKQRAKTVGYVPQTLDLQFNLDVLSFLTLSRYAYDDETPAQRDAILAEVQKATETEHLAGAYLDQLSGGERQRVLIAAALAQKPRLLVLDEPTTAMDPGHRRDLVHLLERLHRTEQLSILVVTHDWNEFLHLSPQILALKDGSVAFQCESNQLRDHLNDLFGCSFQHFAQDNHWISFPEYRS